jgi:hypothetical protein
MLGTMAFAFAAFNTKARTVRYGPKGMDTCKKLRKSGSKILRKTGIVGGKTAGDIYALGARHTIITRGTVNFVCTVKYSHYLFICRQFRFG